MIREVLTEDKIVNELTEDKIISMLTEEKIVEVLGDGDFSSFCQSTSKELSNISLLHGMTLYNGKIYGTSRVASEDQSHYNIVVVDTDDYDDVNYYKFKYLGEEDDFYYIQSLESCAIHGKYIYAIGTVKEPGKSYSVAYLIIQFDTELEDYKVFELDRDVYGTIEGAPIAIDGDIIFIAGATKYTKFLITQLEEEGWDKFNGCEKGGPGIEIEGATVVEHYENPRGAHSLCVDDDWLWVNFSTSRWRMFQKVSRTTLIVDSTIYKPRCSDDIAQTDTHVFLGAEESKYPGIGVIAIRKSDLKMTALGDLDLSYSYGVFENSGVLYNTQTGEQECKLYNIDYSNPDNWGELPEFDEDPENWADDVRELTAVDDYLIQKFNFDDCLATPNEIVFDGDTIHMFLWDSPAWILKFTLLPGEREITVL